MYKLYKNAKFAKFNALQNFYLYSNLCMLLLADLSYPLPGLPLLLKPSSLLFGDTTKES